LKLHSEAKQKKLKEERLERKQASKGKLMSTGLKAVDLQSGAGE
jgi:hypothetical protein